LAEGNKMKIDRPYPRKICGSLERMLENTVEEEVVKKFDPSKPAKLRDGTPVEIIRTDLKGEKSILALADFGTHHEAITYRPHGRWVGEDDGEEDRWDLVNVTERHSYWLVFYKEGTPTRHETRRRALEYASGNPRNPIACIKVEFEEGEGIS